MAPQHGVSIVDYALAWARRGFAVFPLHGIDGGKCTCGRNCDSPGKHPLTQRGFHDASTDAGQIRAWFERWPRANYGVTGLLVVDVDPRNGGAWRNLLSPARGDVATWRAITGGGGEHVFFKQQDPPIGGGVKIAPGIDLKGSTGYVVGVGSLHASGKRYRWAQCSPRDVDLAEAPKWLVEFVACRRVADLDDRRSDEHWQRLIRDGADEGCRNSSAASLAGYLLRHGVKPSIALDLLLKWNACNRPPLSDGEVARILKSIAQRELARRQSHG
jgi:hypothetical protein